MSSWSEFDPNGCWGLGRSSVTKFLSVWQLRVRPQFAQDLPSVHCE